MSDNRARRARPRGKPQDGYLSEERLRFCDGILEGKSLRQAYEESGFLARGKDAATNGRQLLREPEVQYYLAARRLELRAREILKAERVLEEIANIAFLDPAEIVAEDLEGPADIAKLPERVRRAIVGWGYDRSGRFTVELADRLTALHQLAKVLGLYQGKGLHGGDANPGAALTTVFWQFVMGLHAQQGLSIREAYEAANRDPDRVEDWARSIGALPSHPTAEEVGEKPAG